MSKNDNIFAQITVIESQRMRLDLVDISTGEIVNEEFGITARGARAAIKVGKSPAQTISLLNRLAREKIRGNKS